MWLKSKRDISSKSSNNLNSLPNNRFLDWSKLKAFADNKINVTELHTFFLGWVENIVGKGENAGYQHFLLFPQCFQKGSFSGSLKVGIVWERVMTWGHQDFLNLKVHQIVQPNQWLVGWLVGCIGFNATLTAEVISWQSVTHMCFLAFSHQY